MEKQVTKAQAVRLVASHHQGLDDGFKDIPKGKEAEAIGKWYVESGPYDIPAERLKEKVNSR